MGCWVQWSSATPGPQHLLGHRQGLGKLTCYSTPNHESLREVNFVACSCPPTPRAKLTLDFHGYLLWFKRGRPEENRTVTHTTAEVACITQHYWLLKNFIKNMSKQQKSAGSRRKSAVQNRGTKLSKLRKEPLKNSQCRKHELMSVNFKLYSQ